MKSTGMKIVAGLALATALVWAGMNVNTQALGATNQEAQKLEKTISPGKRLEGTWRVQVSIRDCASGAELRNFPAMLTFAQGGTLTETTTGFPPTVRSPGHGVWYFLGDHNYRGISEAFLFSPTGVWIGTQRLTQSIEIAPSGDELNSTATNEIFDTFGNLTTSGCATAVATRFE
jgi:hypothetical protein